MNEGKKRSERDEDKRRKGKGNLLTGEMERYLQRYHLHGPEVHTGPFAVLRPSTLEQVVSRHKSN